MRSRAKAVKPIIAGRYSVQRDPRYVAVIKPPMNGAKKGPVKTVTENTVIAKPLVLLSNISEKTAATTARGHAAKKPPQNLQIMIVCRSLATATATWKMEN